MKCVILAGGMATRMRPFASYIPKHMIGICGKPLLEYTLYSLRKNGIREVCIVVGYQKEIIMNYFRDGERFKMKISYFIQRETLGTAHALRVAESFVADEEAFFLIYGDTFISSKAILNMNEKYKETRASAILALAAVKNPERFGVAIIENDRIKHIIEKPSLPPSNIVCAGAFILRPLVFEYIKKLAPSLRGEYELTEAIENIINDDLPVYAVLIDDEDWAHIKTPSDLIKAQDIINKQFRCI